MTAKVDQQMADAMKAYTFFNHVAKQFGCKAEVDIYNKTVNFVGPQGKLKKLVEYLGEHIC